MTNEQSQTEGKSGYLYDLKFQKNIWKIQFIS